MSPSKHVTNLLNITKTSEKLRKGNVFTARKRSLGQGNIFAPVCHSVHRKGYLGVPPVHTTGNACWDMVNKRVVCILLECILVTPVCDSVQGGGEV